jgi:hypothetical protein
MDDHARAVKASYIYAQRNKDDAVRYIQDELPEYSLDEGLSDYESVVLHNPNKNHTIIGYRGTLLHDKDDLVEDAKIGLGLHHIKTIHRQKQADMKYLRVSNTYRDANITVAGHSLGGVQSYYVATKHGLEGHHYNVGESPLPGVETMHLVNSLLYSNRPEYKKQHIYHAERYTGYGYIHNGSDPISQGTKHLPGQHHFVKVNTITGIGAHYLDNFIIPRQQKKPMQAATPQPPRPIPYQETEMVVRTIPRKKKKHIK